MVNRRRFLAGLGGAVVWAGFGLYEPLVFARPKFKSNPFTLGVASGDPTSDGVVLWTRLAPDPLHGGGMPPHAVEVKWQIAADENMRRIVQQGIAHASPKLAHSVHVEVKGLKPSHHYWYRFECAGIESPIARTRTAPAMGATPDQLKFAFVSCQSWGSGHYAAYRHLAEQDVDLVLHLGDYIYEPKISGRRGARDYDLPAAVLEEAHDLATYRLRYALYKLDPHLQAAHHAAPFSVTWDDHEVANDYASDIDNGGMDPKKFLARRAAAYQAYYEHLPLRQAQMPHGPDLPLFRRLEYGDLANFHLLDTRQYRSRKPHNSRADNPQLKDASRVMMGAKQEGWLKAGLSASRARWNVIPQQVFMTQFAGLSDEGKFIMADKWDGYPVERNRLMRFLHEAKIKNTIVLTGDSHKNLVSDLKLDFENADSPTVGVEFAGTAISSGGMSPEDSARVGRRLEWQPHLKWFDGVKRGYASCVLDRKTCHTNYWAVDDAQDPQSPVRQSASFIVEDNVPGVKNT